MSPRTCQINLRLIFHRVSALSLLIFSHCTLPSLAAVLQVVSEPLPVPGTRISLYNRKGFINSPSTLPPTVLRPDPRVGCYNLPPELAGQLGSGVIEWNVKDNQADGSAPHGIIICNVVYVFHGADCTGGAIGRMIPGGASKASPTKYTYANAVYK